MNELEKSEVKRKFFCEMPDVGESSFGVMTEAFHCIHMDFIKPVSIIVSGIFTGSMIHTFMVITPFIQPIIMCNTIGVDQCSGCIVALSKAQWWLPDIGEHLNHNLSTPLYHPENRWLLFFQRTTPSSTL